MIAAGVSRGGIGLMGLVLMGACVADAASEQCEYGVRRLAVEAQDRSLLGAGAGYPADTSLQAMSDELYRSQSQRRVVAWNTVQKLLTPIRLTAEPAGLSGQLPLFRSWYGGDEVQRLFQELYEGLPAAGRQDQQRFEQAAIDDAFGWNLSAIEDLANWPMERRDAYLAAIDSEAKLGGIAGVGRTSYSPDAVRHLLRSYPEVMRCMQEGVPAAVEAGEGPSLQQALREPIALASCSAQSFGPFFVGSADELRAGLDLPAAARSGAVVSIHTRDAPEDPLCRADQDDLCHAFGPEPLFVTVEAGPDGLEAALQIDYASAEPTWAACLESAFPTTSVIVKADWRRAQFGELLPSYDTSAAALRGSLSQNDAQGWGPGDRQVDPREDEIYSIELPNGQRYRLAALHIMTKELSHWQWITLWWSDRPDVDFGADRPEEIAALGPWGHYKMCVVTDFAEGDADPEGGFQESAASLAAALKAVHGGVGSPSWCSNPYLELGAGNKATNCIGCHQHGGEDLRAESIIADPALFPAHGRTQLRNNFPHDYSWALSDGDELALGFKAVIDYFQ